MSPKKAKLQGKMRGAFVSAKTEITRRVTIPEDQLSDELLWGIPNHVTLKFIATKLPWRAWQVAATLSADWQRAFQGRMVYDARVRWQTTQTFFVVLCFFSIEVSMYDQYRRRIHITLHKRTLSLFSPSEERWFRLPPLPGCYSDMTYDDNYVFLDGAIYNLGGARNGIGCIPSKEVHVLDLARHPLEWRRCASMQAQRCHLDNIGVMQGRIFVFAGCEDDTGGCEDDRNEVYDPKVDAWSWIAPIRPSAHVSTVFSVGQQFFVCYGKISSSLPGPLPGRGSVRHEKADELESKFMADLYGETKLVVIDGPQGPKLIRTSDEDAEDDIDGLHKTIEYCLANLDFKLSRDSSSPARDLASCIDSVEQEGWSPLIEVLGRSFLGVYDPGKDEWREFEREILGTHNVDRVQPEEIIALSHTTALVWKMSL